MPAVTILDSPDFQRLRRDGRARLASPNDVFVISRFNRDDRTLAMFFSTPYGPHVDPTLMPATLTGAKSLQRALPNTLVTTPSGAKRPLMTENEDVFIYENVPQQGGGHAEEKFLRSIPALIDRFGFPRLMEIFVSRIPCPSTSSAWIVPPDTLFSSIRRRGGTLWPQGCGPKFYKLFQENHDIDFELIYEEESLGVTQAQALSWVTRMTALPNTRVGLAANFGVL